MYSLLIKKATIVDGSGKKSFVGDIAVEGDKIVEVAPNIKTKAGQVVEAEGLVLSPGFIDIQNHSDTYWQLFDNPTLDSMLMQGFTTILVGNCGASLAPILSPESLLSVQKWHNLSGSNINWSTFEEFANDMSKRKYGSNVASMVGYSTIRRGIVGDEPRGLTKNEESALRYVVEEALASGAFGLSTGLGYSHEILISELELYNVAQVLADKGAMLAVHLRNEADEIVESVAEAIDLAMHSDVNLKISHLKIRGKENHRHFEDLLTSLESGYSKGVRVSFDAYPYNSVWQPLYTYLPKWAIESGRKQLIRLMENQDYRKKILSELHNSGINFADMIIASTSHPFNVHGKTIGSIARNMNMSSEETVLELIDKGGAEVLVFHEALDDEHVEALIGHPLALVSSDGAGFPRENPAGPLNRKLVHPRCFGTSAKFIKNFGSTSLEEVIAKLTSRPAKIAGIENRGLIKTGNYADLVLWNQTEIADNSTLKNPFRYPSGIEQVFVNGMPVIDESGKINSSGKFLRK